MLSKPDAVFRVIKKLAKRAVGTGGMCRRAARALEAGCGFPGHKKARQARGGNRGRHRGHVSKSAHSLEAGCGFSSHKKNESASDTRRLVFCISNYFPGNCSRLREHVPPPTHAPGVHCALGARAP
ncbi:MAG: hypothetical protein FWF77_02760 [Defluviitaleaceae bacterium]|nr:hypothetical protein [Defluviitaleaceae bacterium]